MSEYFFGVWHGRVEAALATALEAVAVEHGAHFVCVELPEGPRCWFACPNRGAPFDEQAAKATKASIAQSGLIYPPVRSSRPTAKRCSHT